MTAPDFSNLPFDPITDRTQQFLRDLNDLFVEAGREGPTGDFLRRLLEAGIHAVGGKRGFFALVQNDTGELHLSAVAGPDWTDQNRGTRLQLAQEENRGISGHVVMMGESYVTGDVSHDQYYVRIFDDVKSEISVPILSNSSQPLGVMTIDSPEADRFDTDDCARLTALSQVAGVALTVQGFRDREKALINIGKTLTGMLDVNNMTDKVVQIASIALRFEDCSLFLLDEQTNMLILRSTSGRLASEVGKPSYKLGEGLTGWVALNGRPIRVEAPQDDVRWLGHMNEFSDDDIGPFLAVPIISRNKTLGVIRVLRRKSHATWYSNRFTDVDERVLSTVASQIGVAMENARNIDRLVTSQRMSAWGELSARSAHMIGNRAFALKGDVNELGYLINELPDGTSKVAFNEISQSLGNGIERLEEILREFRDFVMAAQSQLISEDINRAIHETLKETFPKRTDIELRLLLNEKLPAVKLDNRKFKRALGELIENAISYQPNGGFVGISSDRLNHDIRIGESDALAQTYVVLEVSDAGPGVPYESKDKIFQPFYTSRTKGMGLGLSIVKGVVESHHGLLREIGEPGVGARFQIFLPV